MAGGEGVRGYYWAKAKGAASWSEVVYQDSSGVFWHGDCQLSHEDLMGYIIGPRIPEPEHMVDLRRAESLIAGGKDLPFKPSFGMLVIEWLRQVAKEGK